jgi:hypothetical protein
LLNAAVKRFKTQHEEDDKRYVVSSQSTPSSPQSQDKMNETSSILPHLPSLEIKEFSESPAESR